MAHDDDFSSAKRRRLERAPSSSQAAVPSSSSDAFASSSPEAAVPSTVQSHVAKSDSRRLSRKLPSQFAENVIRASVDSRRRLANAFQLGQDGDEQSEICEREHVEHDEKCEGEQARWSIACV